MIDSKYINHIGNNNDDLKCNNTIITTQNWYIPTQNGEEAKNVWQEIISIVLAKTTFK